MTRGQKVARAQALRAKGLKLREIAERMGAPISTVDSWVNDPDLSKHRARRYKYGGTCEECGAPTDGSWGPGKASRHCRNCAPKANRLWTEEAIIAAIQAWARESGGIPPAATDWNPGRAITLGHPEKAEKFYADDAWPCVNTVVVCFGSWSAAIEASGFSPRASSTYGRDGEDMELCQEIRERYEAGESTLELADAYGVGSHGIAYRIWKAGGQLRSQSEAQQLRHRKAAA